MHPIPDDISHEIVETKLSGNSGDAVNKEEHINITREGSTVNTYNETLQDQSSSGGCDSVPSDNNNMDSSWSQGAEDNDSLVSEVMEYIEGDKSEDEEWSQNNETESLDDNAVTKTDRVLRSHEMKIHHTVEI